MIQPTIKAARAVGVEFVRRTIRLPLTIGVAALVLLLVAGAWLVSQNAWWWFVEVVFIIGAVLCIGLLLVLRFVIKLADPNGTREQKRAVVDFVDKLQRVSDNLQTPQLVIVYRVVRDTIWPRPDGFIESLSRDSKALKPDFAALCRLFEAG